MLSFTAVSNIRNVSLTEFSILDASSDLTSDTSFFMQDVDYKREIAIAIRKVHRLLGQEIVEKLLV